jgi:hypothetical protein
MTLKKLTFYDVKAKKKFSTSNYTITSKPRKANQYVKVGNKTTERKPKRFTFFAVAKAPSGIDAYRIVGSASRKDLRMK